MVRQAELRLQKQSQGRDLLTRRDVTLTLKGLIAQSSQLRTFPYQQVLDQSIERYALAQWA